MSAPSHTTTPPAPTDLVEELLALRGIMAASGLDEAGHKRAAELLLATYGDEFTQHDLAAALVHATLAGGPTGAGEGLRKSLAYWLGAAIDLQRRVSEAEDTITGLRASLKDAGEQVADADAQVAAQVAAMRTELEQARAARERAVTAAAALRDQLRAETERAEGFAARTAQMGKDQKRFRAQVQAARRLEDAMREAEIAALQPRAAAQATVKADPFTGLDPDEPTFPATLARRPHTSRLLAGECHCGGAICRNQGGDGPWRHSDTDAVACHPGDPDSPNTEPVKHGAQFDQVWMVERGAKRVADECANCGGGINRGQFDNGPWQHYDTHRCDEAVPKSFTDLIDARIVVGVAGGRRAHGVLARIADSTVFLHPCEDGPAEIPLHDVDNMAALPPRADAGIWRKDESGSPVNTLTADDTETTGCDCG